MTGQLTTTEEASNMFKVYSYNYDADTDTSWKTFEFTLDNLNGREFVSDNEVASLNTYIQSTIYDNKYDLVGILDGIDDVFYFVTLEKRA
jgi:hypothetical protein